MDVTYTSEKYDPNKSYARYVRKDWDGAYHWCEVGLGDEADLQLSKRIELTQKRVGINCWQYIATKRKDTRR